MKKVVFAIVMLLLSINGIAQQQQSQQYAAQTFDNSIATDFAYATYERSDIDMVKYDKDPSAHALVLKEYGKVAITSNGNSTALTFEYHVRIKIFDSKGFGKGVIELPFYIQDNGSYEEIRTSSIQAVTFYKDDSGATQSVDLNPDSIITVKTNKHWSMLKFNMPNVKNGCIIEYKYRLDSPYLDKLRTWDFQSDIPKVISDYEVHIPTVFGYNVSLHGPLKLTKDSATVEKSCFESTNLVSDCTVDDYEMRNIPAFKNEVDMTSPNDFLSALHFQLTSGAQLNNFVLLNQAFQEDVAQDWGFADKSLRNNDNFGGQINRKSIFKDRIPTIISGKTDDLDKAKAIYAYIQKNITFNTLYDVYADEGIKRALDKHTGNSADINLALVVALQTAGINANPVIISTRDNGIVTKIYPALAEFNDVIAGAIINGKAYLLDATNPQLQFGLLPFQDLTDRGRVIPLEKPSYWLSIKTAQKRTNTYMADLKMAEDGKISGTITHYSLGYEGYEKRTAIKSFKTTDDYVKSLFANTPGVKLIKSTINNLDSLDMPVEEVYQIEIDNPNATAVSFNPVLLDKLSDNPFKTDTRIYPVDFGMPSANSFTLKLELPANYNVDTPLQSATSTLPDNGGELVTEFNNSDNTVIYTVNYHLDKAQYATAAYPEVKDFFNKIISAENITVNLKKK